MNRLFLLPTVLAVLVTGKQVLSGPDSTAPTVAGLSGRQGRRWAEVAIARNRSRQVDAGRFPPITAITSVRKKGKVLVVRGTTTDNGEVARVTVNGTEAKVGAGGQWEVNLAVVPGGTFKITELAKDVAGNE